MSRNSESVKKWRKATKERMIKSMGSRCVICGYDHCNEALEFHHLNPNEKDFNFGKVMAKPRKWTKIVEELRKCVMLCSNCHREVHSNILTIPNNCTRFDESFSIYEIERTINGITYVGAREQLFDNCPICDKKKPIQNKHCSLECAGKAHRKINWDKINLLEELKTKSIIQIAEELNVSDATVRKRYKKLVGEKEHHYKSPLFVSKSINKQIEINGNLYSRYLCSAIFSYIPDNENNKAWIGALYELRLNVKDGIPFYSRCGSFGGIKKDSFHSKKFIEYLKSIAPYPWSDSVKHNQLII